MSKKEKKMRKPNMKDIFLASKIVRKIGLKEANIDFKGTQEEVGGKLLLFLFENLDKTQDEICELFGGILEIEASVFLEMSIEEVIEQLKGMEGLSDFFTSLSKRAISKSTTSFSAGMGA